MLVKDRMTLDPMTVTPDTAFPYAFRLIREKRIRHLPVVETGWLHGIVSIGDVIRALGRKVEAENRYMRDYIQGKFF